jgi:hypothetical protein
MAKHFHLSVEARAKISASRKGKPLSREHRASISDGLKIANKNPKVIARRSLATSRKNNPMYGVHRFGKDAPMYGKHHSAETKQKLSKARKLSAEDPSVQAKISLALQKRFANPENHPMYDKHHSKKTRDQLRQSAIGKHVGTKNGMFGRISYAHRKWSKSLWHYYRSRWEFEVCSFLKSSNIPYRYEATRFDLGEHTWTPDIEFNEKLYLEIKGQLDKKSRLKIPKFLRKHLDKTLILLSGTRVSKELKNRTQGLSNVIFLRYDKQKEWQRKLLEILKEQGVNT